MLPLFRSRTPHFLLLRRPQSRLVSTLPDNPTIFVHPGPKPNEHTLSLLPTSPPNPSLSLGTTATLPPTPASFTENPAFLPLLRRLLSAHAASDPAVQSDALAFSSSGGQPLRHRHRESRGGGTGAGGANVQGGYGGAGVGGYVHVHDQRVQPPFGRIPDPEDILGSLLVNGEGRISDGSWVDGDAYRLVTGEGGVMRLSEYLAEKVRAELEGIGK